VARILVIDDERQIREFLAYCLEREGHEVIALAEGSKAADVHLDEPVDLLITDLYMPNQDGLRTIQVLRSTSPGLPVIAISGGNIDARMSAQDSLELAAGIGVGATRVLSKPFGGRRLIEIARKMLG
jgi:DNA-binding response OmpR family regulator